MRSNAEGARKRPLPRDRIPTTLLNVVMPDPDVNETQASLELNFLVGKVKYSVRRVRNNK